MQDSSIAGIDHAVILVRDIDAAVQTYRRLGFSPTPRGYHSFGTQNHCLMFGANYLELLSVVRPDPATQYFSSFLEAGEGAGAIAFSSNDSQASHARLLAAGIHADEPVDFSRPVELADGAHDARFRITQLPVAATPGCRTFLCQHFTPELVWRPEYQQHPLGVTGIAGLTLTADQPREAIDAFARVTGLQPEATDDGWAIVIGSVRLEYSGDEALKRRLNGARIPDRPAPMIAAVHLRVADAGITGDVLSRGGVAPTVLPDGSLAIDAEEACGVVLTFRT